ncbi:MAG: SpoIIE family protein phosphatase [Calditrichae bacterium]|nr:SpoIIE family protein phosphatase [Calditrichota bacterium]MCB9059142.1 SpoIIE family protein phosphatase [Calditrichia bacterium]
MSDYLNSFRLRNQEKIDSNQMDPRHLELSSLFEFSQTLNSSLDLKSILDSLLFVPMGRMMIGKGMVLLAVNESACKIATVKGLPADLIGSTFEFNDKPGDVVLINSDSDYSNLPEIFIKNKIKLLIPIKSMNQVTGMLVLGQKLLAPGFNEDEIHFLSSIGNIAAPAIENAKVFEKLNTVNRQLDHKIQELNTLFEIGNELNRLFDQKEILKRLSYSLMGQMLINQFFVAVKTDNTLKVVYKKGSIFSEENINKCLKSGIGKNDFQTPLRIEQTEEQLKNKFCDFGIKIIVPMVVQDQVRGYIFLGSKLNKTGFSESDVEFLSTLANIAIISIENARLFQETLEKKRLEEELNLAKNIQTKLLPDTMPVISRYDVHGYNIPSKSVGGDYFDIIKLNNDEFIFTIADVSGKGMPASLLMSNLQAGLHTLHQENYSLAEITFRLNNLIYKNTSIEKYITFFIAKLNIPQNKIFYVNAGHNPPYLFFKDGNYEELSTGGIILGMMADMPYEIGELQMKPGSYLTMFTDGVTEAMSPDDQPFEEFRVIDFFKQEIAKPVSCEQINLKMIETLYKFAGDPTKDDDITILTLSRKE